MAGAAVAFCHRDLHDIPLQIFPVLPVKIQLPDPLFRQKLDFDREDGKDLERCV